MSIVVLADAHDEASFGGKAVQLGRALRAGLPVPDGFAVSAEAADGIVAGDRRALDMLASWVATLRGPCAVRSSAVGEDAADASFAGQHATRLNVTGFDAVVEAVGDVWRSGRSEAALAYRRRVNAAGTPQVGVVLQRLVPAATAGVLFTCDPVSGRDEILIEAGWGLGEAVVQGIVVPDRYRLTRDGQVVERIAGVKEKSIRLAPDGGTVHETLPAHVARRLCLGYPDLRSLHALARRCDEVFGAEPHDIEWAIEDGAVFLLQRRPVTRNGKAAR